MKIESTELVDRLKNLTTELIKDLEKIKQPSPSDSKWETATLALEAGKMAGRPEGVRKAVNVVMELAKEVK